MGNNGNVGLGNYGGAHSLVVSDLLQSDDIRLCIGNGIRYVFDWAS